MASPHERRPLAAVPGFRDPGSVRVDVYQLYREQMHCFAALPGQISEFQQTSFGYEWRCQCELDPGRGLQLQFSMLDLQGQQQPAAVLYLLTPEERIGLSLEELQATHEQLNGELVKHGGSIEALEKADEFISALVSVKDTLGESLTWE